MSVTRSANIWFSRMTNPFQKSGKTRDLLTQKKTYVIFSY